MEKNNKLQIIQQVVEQGLQLGLDLTAVKEKLSEVLKSSADETIRIVLLGAFSDGKTSAIAGMFEQVFDSMKIDIDESSDELEFYRPVGLEQGYEIVDTPGLFGSKEKENDGQKIKYSEITEKYISEAHILIYICNACNPLKESHKNALNLVLRTFDKLDSTIFVLNKMDEAGYDLLDDFDFKNGSKIKSEYLVKRLKEIIGLTEEEEKNLKIACISADPKGKGMSYWLANRESYLSRSHINDLKKEMNSVIQSKDRNSLIASVDNSVLQDLVMNLNQAINVYLEPLYHFFRRNEEFLQDMRTDCKNLEKDLIFAKGEMTQRLNDLRNSIINHINNVSSFEDLQNVIETDLGFEKGEITCHIFNRNINQILEECINSNQNSTGEVANSFTTHIEKQNELSNELITKGGKFIKSLNFDNKMVLTARNVLFKQVKFKPHGAVKIAKNLNKAVAALGILLEVYEWWRTYKDKEKLNKIKSDLKSEIEETFHNIFSSFDNTEVYYKNYAPVYVELRSNLDNMERSFAENKLKRDKVEDFHYNLRKLFGNDIVDVEYEEI